MKFKIIFLCIYALLAGCAAWGPPEPADVYDCGVLYDVLVDRSRPERAWNVADITVVMDSDHCFGACADLITGTVYVAPGPNQEWNKQHEICHLKWWHTYHSGLDHKPRGFEN